MGLNRCYIVAFYFTVILKCVTLADNNPVWKWTCEDNRCLKTLITADDDEPALTLEACKMFCKEYGLLWPKPTGHTDLGSTLSKVNFEKIEILPSNLGKADDLISAAGKRFKSLLLLSIPKDLTPKTSGKAVEVYLVNKNPDVREFTLNLDEGYSIRGSPAANNKINVTITANNFFGLRHGLETLSQLFMFDNIRNHLLMVRNIEIDDNPVYPYRGLLLDTSRNYYSVKSILRILDGMSAVKLNTFHWHITDSHSFPFVSKKRPSLSKTGAYSTTKVYTMEDIKDIVKYGLERGVRVMPEFDAPAHVGEGWQDTDLTVCFNAMPWGSYCVEPPCGQFNPVKEELYSYLDDIYTDIEESFKPDIFHMGGDEVSEKCWNTSLEIQQFMIQNRWDLEKASFLKLWNYFQQKAQEKAFKAFGKVPLIMWTSTLTDYIHVDKYLDKNNYIIQVWTTGSDPQILGLLNKGYRLIISNYDALYFDCGFGSWVSTGNNWCSPYIGWKKVYTNSPAEMAPNHSELILGGEAAIWSEQIDESTLDGRVWPRAAALAERLWAEPKTSWQQAEQRMFSIRERLVSMGIAAEALVPEWCYQNEDYCTVTN